LNLSVTSARASQTESFSRVVAENFVHETATLAESVANQPDATEIRLGETRTQVESNLRLLGDQLAGSLANMPDTDPTSERNVQLQQWNMLYERFQVVQRQLDDTLAAADALRHAPEPSHGIVPSRARQETIDGDLDLQQDLRELNVRLAELKLRLLGVWQDSSATLEELLLTARTLAESAGRLRDPASLGESCAPLADAAGIAQAYEEGLTSFATQWVKEFSAVRLMEPDPFSAELLDVHTRLRKLLDEFTFQSGKEMKQLEELIRKIDMGAIDEARFHVLQSELTRRFHVLHQAHHQFESLGRAIEPSHNFRLDAVTQSAHGLRRRTQQRLEAIDEKLGAEALRRARDERANQLTEADERAGRLRHQSDEIVGEMIAVQIRINGGIPGLENYLRATATRDVIVPRIAALDRDLSRATADVQDAVQLRRQMSAMLPNVTTTFQSQAISPTGWERGRIGMAAGLLTMLALGFVLRFVAD